MKLQFRAEFFNLFNTPQFYPPNASIGSRDAGTIIGVRGGSNRRSQLGLKLDLLTACYCVHSRAGRSRC